MGRSESRNKIGTDKRYWLRPSQGLPLKEAGSASYCNLYCGKSYKSTPIAVHNGS